jgi:hypothetical protein
LSSLGSEDTVRSASQACGGVPFSFFMNSHLNHLGRRSEDGSNLQNLNALSRKWSPAKHESTRHGDTNRRVMETPAAATSSAPPLPARNLCNEGDWALMLPSDGERRLMRVRRGTKF